MTPPCPEPGLREIRRGEGPDEIHFINMEGTVLISHAHGVNPEERVHTTARALRLLRAPHPAPGPGGRDGEAQGCGGCGA